MVGAHCESVVLVALCESIVLIWTYRHHNPAQVAFHLATLQSKARDGCQARYLGVSVHVSNPGARAFDQASNRVCTVEQIQAGFDATTQALSLIHI